jgi:hypothetical protein
MSANTFYRPKLQRVVVIDITDHAAFVEIDLNHLLRKPEKGIYARSTSELLINSRESGPRLGQHSYYYHDKQDGRFVAVNHAINCIEDIRGPVYSAAFEPLVTALMLSDAETFLTEAPNYPVIGLRVVELFVTNYIERHLRWKTGVSDVWFDLAPYMQNLWRDPYEQVSAFEKVSLGAYAEVVQEETARRLDNTLGPLLEQVDQALAGKNKEWAIVQVTRHMNRLRIQVFEDYRICEWMNEHDQGRNMQSLSQCNEEVGDDIARLWRA